mgnify:CR=1 FL=1
MLAVDTEGFDALVIEGAAVLLARRAIDVLEFEAHSMPLHVLRRQSRAKRIVTSTLWRELCGLARSP